MPDDPTASSVMRSITGESGAFVRVLLFSNDVTPGQATTLSQLQEPDWPNYSSKHGELVWAGPDADDAGGAEMTSQLLRFTRGAGGAARQRVYGFGIAVKPPFLSQEVLLTARRFAVPVEMTEAGASFGLEVGLAAAKTNVAGNPGLAYAVAHEVRGHQRRLPRTLRAQLRDLVKVLQELARREAPGVEAADTKGRPYVAFFGDEVTDQFAQAVLGRAVDLLAG